MKHIVAPLKRLLMSILYAKIERGYRPLVVLALGLWFASAAHGQVGVQPSPYLPSQYFDNNGKILSGGCLFTYESGTTTPLATYSDAAGMNANTNPVILSSSGRAFVFLQSQAYTLVLKTQGGSNCVSGQLIWSVDGINPGANSILSSNNVWTGTNTWQSTSNFNGPTNFNAGFTSTGPNNLGGGGSMSGTYSGSPVFSGTPHFSGMPIFDDGFSVNGTATFNGQIASTLATGTAPFIISSQTEVPNLNANFLEGGTWETPLAIGSTTPMNGTFTGLHVTTNFQIASSVLVGGIKGTDSNLLSAGTVTGTGNTLCTDANGGATTSGCSTSGITQISIATGSSNCTTDAASYHACSDVLTWSNAFSDSSYVATCSGQNTISMSADSQQAATLNILSQTASTITVYTQSQRSTPAANFTKIYCIGMHSN